MPGSSTTPPCACCGRVFHPRSGVRVIDHPAEQQMEHLLGECLVHARTESELGERGVDGLAHFGRGQRGIRVQPAVKTDPTTRRSTAQQPAAQQPAAQQSTAQQPAAQQPAAQQPAAQQPAAQQPAAQQPAARSRRASDRRGFDPRCTCRSKRASGAGGVRRIAGGEKVSRASERANISASSLPTRRAPTSAVASSGCTSAADPAAQSRIGLGT
jgi:hypothetical protein